MTPTEDRTDRTTSKLASPRPADATRCGTDHQKTSDRRPKTADLKTRPSTFDPDRRPDGPKNPPPPINQSIINHKRDFGRFRVDCTKTEGDVFWTPICECDIFRKAMAGRRFFGVSKNTPRGTRATPDLAKQERRAPRPAVQNVAETRPKIAPTRPTDAARLAKATAGRDAAFSTCKIRRREAPSRRLIGHRRVAVFGVAQREGRTPPGEAARREAGVRRPRDHRPKTRPSTGKQPVAPRGS